MKRGSKNMRVMLFSPCVKTGVRISRVVMLFIQTTCEKEALRLGILFKQRVVLESAMN